MILLERNDDSEKSTPRLKSREVVLRKLITHLYTLKAVVTAKGTAAKC